MAYTATNVSSIQSFLLNDTETLIQPENENRLQIYISVTGGSCWLKFHDQPDNNRDGVFIAENTQFPFHFTSNVVYYGPIYAINIANGENPTIRITTLEKQ